MAPLLPAVAAAQSAGLITGEHVGVDPRRHQTPAVAGSTPITAAQFEVDLVRVAVGVGPKELRETAELRLFLLDQDGPEPDDAERARKRHFTTTAQGRDAMTAASANFTPEAWAVWEVIFAKYAAPGMCNPADERAVHLGHPQPQPRSTTTPAPWANASTTRCWRSGASR